MSEHIASKAELPEILRPHLDAIVALARVYGVERLEVFGSVMTDRFDPERSDIDFLVKYPTAMRSDRSCLGIKNWRKNYRAPLVGMSIL